MRIFSERVEAFDQWIRGRFKHLNTALEELYFKQADRLNVQGVGDDLKATLRDEGHGFIEALRAEGNTDDGFESAFGVLGNVGMYLGAMRRHELTNPSNETQSPFTAASSLALHVGASLGMAPRFATAHLATHNLAHNGIRKSFTTLTDEQLFIDENTRGILSFQKVADALSRIVPLGMSNAVIDELFADAKTGLQQVMAANERLFTKLDVERFFCNVRPYYKPYRVGRQEYRGANAGDFSGINEIDLLLGLCRANDAYYAQLLVDKMLYMPPRDQSRLREVMTRTSLLDELLGVIDTQHHTAWFKASARAFLDVCELYGKTALQHHDQLVARFIEGPAASVVESHRATLTASGPPLPILLRALETLRDLRTAAPRDDIASRDQDIARVRRAVAGG